MLKAVLFDLDDTLFDHGYAVRLALEDVRSKYKCFGSLSIDELYNMHSIVLEEIHLNDVLSGRLNIEEARKERFKLLFHKAGTPVIDNEHSEAAKIYRERYNNTKRPVEGAVELVRSLFGKLKLAIVSNNLLSEQVPKLRECGLEPYFDVLVTSFEAGISKPDKKLFEIALNKLNITANEAIVIGDSWNKDIVGAHNAGIKAIWLNAYGEICPDPDSAIEIRSLNEVRGLPDFQFS